MIYAVSNTNQFGTNPNYQSQIVRWDPVTGAGTPITDFEEGVSSVSVSDDGSWLAFVSSADLLGTNHDESPELYVMRPDGTGLAQLTSGSFLSKRPRSVFRAVISGSANRIVFAGCIDPLVTCETYTPPLFVIDRDGSNLRQLHPSVQVGLDEDPVGLDISDDGTKIAYMSASQVFGINADGTGNHGFGSSATAGFALSGNGEKIVYRSGSNIVAQAFDGNPATTVVLAGGSNRPSITDDATLVYFYRNASGFQPGIWRVASSGGAPTLIAPSVQPVRLSGGGGRIVARNTELVAIDGSGGNLKQLTTTTAFGGGIDLPTFSPDGSTLYFLSSGREQLAYSFSTGQVTQLTDGDLTGVYPTYLSMSDTGTVVFESSANLTGQNSCGAKQLFRLDPGGPLTQVTACGGPPVYGYSAVGADAQVIAFLSYTSGTPLAAYSINGDGTGLTHVANLTNAIEVDGKIFVMGAGTPTWVAFCGVGVLPGQTQYQLIRVRTDGTGLQQIGNFGTCFVPTISGNGDRLAWVVRGSSDEAFAYEVSTGTIRHLTDDSSPIGAWRPRVTRDGSYVFLPEGRYNLNTLLLEPTAGSLFESVSATFSIDDAFPDATGSRWLIHVNRSPGYAPGYAVYYLADMTAVPSFSVGKGSPTELSWDQSPTSFRYDAIRGSIANLSTSGATVNLGPVTCLEDDSPDNHTQGHGDLAEPAPGEAFFFLYRGSVGFNAAAGSYGQGTGGKERVPSAGGCAP